MKLHTLLVTTFAIASLSAQKTGADPYVNNPKAPVEQPATEGPVNLSVCYEDFSLPLSLAATLQREGPTDPVLYAKILAALGKDTVRQETFLVLGGKSGQKVNNESITEMIYPTEFEPPRVSNAVSTGVTGLNKEGKEIQAPIAPVPGPVGIARIPATPSAFETRNTGFTFEMEATLSDDLRMADLRLVPEHVTLVGHSKAGQEFSTTEMPIFESQRVNTSITTKVNEPFLLGTVSRPPVSKQDPDSANRVWFAFVTVTLVKP